MPDLLPPLAALPLFFIAAALYASVGHGGASGYLALFALLGMAAPEIAPLALCLNVVVASTGLYQYWRSGHFSWRMLLPFVVGSMPAAFVGGMIQVPREFFYVLLGAALLFSAWHLASNKRKETEALPLSRKALWSAGLPIGAGLGLLAGMTGIGGGVFLSPLLLLLRWADVKRTAALSAAFIVLNSLSGLTGQLITTSFDPAPILPLALVVAAGGYFGAKTGAITLQPKTTRMVLAVVLVMAGSKLVIKALVF